MPDAPQTKSSPDWIALTTVGLGLLMVILVILKGGNLMENLQIITGYTILILIFFFGLMILIAMARGDIDLKYLISEPTGHASVSRFQLLIFTFVIGLSLFLVTVGSKPARFPAIPKEILVLLGISATTYAAGKGIQFSNPEASTPVDTGDRDDPHPKTKHNEPAQQQPQSSEQGHS